MAHPQPDLRIFPGSNEMTAYLLRHWRELAGEAVARKGFFAAALSGGTTPAAFYRGLADLRDDFPWDKTHIFLVDERFVPWNEHDSNYGMLRRLFLDAVALPRENRHAIMTTESSLPQAAELYGKELQRFFKQIGSAIPKFDFIGLGMGEDGHIASLFPGRPELAEQERLVVAVPEGSRAQGRITLTLPVINNAAQVCCIITGKGKAAVVKRVIEERDAALPASLVQPDKGGLEFVLDADAASLLNISR